MNRGSQSSSGTLEQSGFTMTELITVIVIVGIMGAMVVPRFFQRSTFDSRGFYEQAIATLRYAQKIAIAQHRFVCVAFPANNRIAVSYDPVPPGASHTLAACPGLALTGPDGQAPFTLVAPGGVSLSAYADFNFDALGRSSFAARQSIAVSGYASPILVEAETGYVH